MYYALENETPVIIAGKLGGEASEIVEVFPSF
jgi:hypothetical protein